jgi:transcriptional regulator with XRE-family HTH domain
VPEANLTVEEREADLGEKLKMLRLSKNLGQKTLAERAGVSTRAVRSLENGEGSTVRTLVCVIRALGREAWFDSVAPVATIDPLALNREAEPRRRASRLAARKET